MANNWRNQFGFDYSLPQDLINYLESMGFQDDSWGNDVSPKWTKFLEDKHEPQENDDKPDSIIVWLDHENPSKREITHRKRYRVCYDTNIMETLLETDDKNEVIHLVDYLFNPTISAIVCQMKKDITAMMNNPDSTVNWDSIKCFGDLHDICDANCLGFACPLLSIHGQEKTLSVIEPAQDEISLWIQAGFPETVSVKIDSTETRLAETLDFLKRLRREFMKRNQCNFWARWIDEMDSIVHKNGESYTWETPKK